MKKQILSFITILVMIMGIIPIGTLTADNTGNGWSFDSAKKTLTITDNEGASALHESDKSYLSEIETIVIGPAFTNIEDNIFANCYNLKNFNVDSNNPNYKSNNGVLYNKSETEFLRYPPSKNGNSCTILKTVAIVHDYAFDGAGKLTSIKLSDNTTSIGAYAFRDCVLLKNLIIPANVGYIGENAFYNCPAVIEYLGNARPPDTTAPTENTTSIQTIASTTTSATSLESTVTSTTSTETATSTEISTSFTTTTSAQTTTSTQITTSAQTTTSTQITTSTTTEIPINWPAIKIPADKKTITKQLIDELSGNRREEITEVYIHADVNSVNSILLDAFEGCISLKKIIVDENNTKYSGVDGILFDKKQELLKLYPINYPVTDYVIPNNVKEIGYYAFKNCYNLKSIVIPDSVTRIGEEAFLGCSKLNSITITNSETKIETRAFGHLTSPDGKSGYQNLDFIIYGHKGSTAEKYANEQYYNPMTFIVIGTVKPILTASQIVYFIECMDEISSKRYDVYADGKVNVIDKAVARRMLLTDNVLTEPLHYGPFNMEDIAALEAYAREIGFAHTSELGFIHGHTFSNFSFCYYGYSPIRGYIKLVEDSPNVIQVQISSENFIRLATIEDVKDWMKSLLSVFPNRPPIVYYPPKNYTVEELNRKPTHFDPKYYEDYAIWYGQTLGMEYDPTIGDLTEYGWGDNPVANHGWESGLFFDKDTNDESFKRSIRSELEYLHSDHRIMHEPKAEYFRVGAYTEAFLELNWPGMHPYPIEGRYLLIVFNDPI